MAPGEEIDAFYVLDPAGTVTPGANPSWRYGMPVVLEQRTRATVNDVYSGVTGLDFPVQLVGTRHDLFIQKSAANAEDDLHDEVRQVAPAPRGLFSSL